MRNERMKYKNYVTGITKSLKEYKELIDAAAVAYKRDKQKIKETAREMQGKWTEEYIDRYKKENDPLIKYKKQIQGYRERFEPTVTKYLEFLKKQLDDYFNGPVKTDFANKINSIKLSGLKLSDLEFELLQNTATSYMERRLLEQLATPHCTVELPDIERMYKAYRDYEAAATGLLYSYAGPNAEFVDALDEKIDDFYAVNMDAYFRCGKEAEFTEYMDNANSILAENKIKRELTENDKKLIDVLVNPNSLPFVAEQTVKDIAANSPELAELFALDERYSQYVDVEE